MGPIAACGVSVALRGRRPVSDRPHLCHSERFGRFPNVTIDSARLREADILMAPSVATGTVQNLQWL